MSIRWSGKKDVIGLIFLLFFPIIFGLTSAIIIPMLINHPVKFWVGLILVSILVVIGVICRKKKD